MVYTGEGYISFFTTAANDALPVEDVIIHVRGADEENRFIEYSLLTDRDGKTQKLALPAPPARYSLYPSPEEVPYANYTVEAIKEGYYTTLINKAAVFSGISGELNINMIPIADNQELTDAPNGNVSFESSENGRL